MAEYDAHRWWPTLSMEAKHRILRDLDAPLSEEVRREIAESTGTDIPDGASLGPEDRQFIRTQGEQVD
ncbi:MULTISPECIES: hypothetical protein [Microbacterium]|uniref:Uncharacterized protein n=1 Tax=Microbacterium resistens TaxID=156977 RepID=A0ABY3RUK7_9MICO|nr:hypothetical protein [Microbacterium resistens]MBW1640371.1 hypothetical protein [Microbacterium resistens]UGS27629.1 hypothetical protein K8F61_05430 [Microbacterium resistens]